MTAIASLLSTTAAVAPPITVAGAATTPLATFLDLLPSPGQPVAGSDAVDERQDDAGDGKTVPQRNEDDDALAWLGVPPVMAFAIPGDLPAPAANAAGIAPTGTSARITSYQGTGQHRTDLPSLISRDVLPGPTLSDTDGSRTVAPAPEQRAALAPPTVPLPGIAADGGPAMPADRPVTDLVVPQRLASGLAGVPIAGVPAVADTKDTATGTASPTGGTTAREPAAFASSRRGGSDAVPRTASSIAPPARAATMPTELPQAATAAPAARVFAAAIHRALGEQDQRPAVEATPPASAYTTPIATVTAAGAAQGGALDMRHAAWPAAMIERIATMRDMAAEHDTRLRLSPDMLGTIDVSLRRDGDAVQVQISAEQAQTRQLLAEAQPRLTELADARGVKLHLTSGQSGATGQQPGGGNGMGGGGGTGGDAPRQQSAPATSLFTRPRSVAERDDAANDERIA
ncbi:flagellar hook-length control protein FliK [Sphingomonas sp. RHCKR47]|uniref:flagellar hook-length control protein FliK n=1 Tax=Sphingomonas citricola TaxID=2862498 RepID=UPI001C669EB3|nr:flagellar hook-length control protein FliK [Sphingomonas citricola]MBW6524087.1 flagellar hook-length control protein FliK [Sphingomonas citricola]